MHDHAPLIGKGHKEERTAEAVRVTIVGAVVNVLLSIGKFIAGVLGSSTAMIADAAHSLSDLVTDAVVFVSVRIASQEADEEHPYGHGRAETIGTAIVGAALVVIGLFILADVVDKLIAKNLVTPKWPAIAGEIVSIVSKEALYHYTVIAGKKQHNEALIANAWHHRSDAFSSVAALIGIGGAMMGFPA